jgi:MinD superfamily P-loop ATPase
LVVLVRQNAKLIAGRESLGCIITDGPPGIGCPAISSLSGASLALLVTEPMLSESMTRGVSLVLSPLRRSCFSLRK